MAKSKTITSGVVHLMDPNGSRVTLRAGDKVPDWATVTNPALFAGKAPEPADATVTTAATPAPVNSGDTGAQSTTETAPTKEPSQKELRDQAKSLGLSTGGSKKDLAQRIAAKLAESAPPAGDTSDDDDRAALLARAKAAGFEVDENTTDDELAALLDD